ncbi:ABC-type oligopeptide transport system, ATPase component [Halanaeroarchaeum sp. HSR-CO]|uniref:ABC transporter ATP-binding protein n=1 Tax=Halanaeroarchaeum sp. HSR-CO TaxID=2866382 RepID=UPI00217D5D8C|nr:ABC transporter ATP-binding protein [Halanaeroarchaeum sp. HSR-CO]UWG46395.1 ABC-type oligopeptide transport system, ATPase component [Halanaeroarchaeum sp. HSR-CO]
MSLQDRTDQHSDAIVEVNDLKKYYESGGVGPFAKQPVKAVDGVNFDIRRGETLGLVGESGCGKTTLGRTLIQLETATEGEVLFEGTDVTRLSGDELVDWKRNAQMVFQDPQSSLNDRMTVGEIVREPLDVHDWKTPSERRERVRELLSTVGLQEEHYYRYPHQFSGGQRQRIGIARALALEPEFVVLDEPVSALDVSVQAQVLNLLEDLQDEFDLTYLFIAHDLSVVRHICDRVAVMYLGHIMEIGPTEELFRNPKNPYTISLLSAIPEPDPTVDTRGITLRGTPPSPRDPPAGCPFTTRCPMKLRPDRYEDVDDDVWDAIEAYREIVRERAQADRSLREIAKEYLGLETKRTGIEEILEDVFGALEVPRPVQEHVDEAARYMADDDAAAARELLREEFGSVCDMERPEYHRVSETGRESFCHRHRRDEEEPDQFVGDDMLPSFRSGE